MYWKNGNIKEKFNLLQDYAVGEYTLYHENGNIKKKESYPNKPIHDGEKVGEIQYFDENGKRMETHR